VGVEMGCNMVVLGVGGEKAPQRLVGGVGGGGGGVDSRFQNL